MNDTWRGARDITGGFVNGLGKGSGSTNLQNYSRGHLMSRAASANTERLGQQPLALHWVDRIDWDERS